MADGPWLSEKQQDAWRSFQRMRLMLTAHLIRDFHDNSALSDSDYEVMAHLSEGQDHRMRLKDLGCALRWEKSRLSHQLARMEKRGLVARSECPSDGRGAFFALTEDGWQTLVKAAPSHVATVREAFIEALTDEELQQLAQISKKVMARITELEN